MDKEQKTEVVTSKAIWNITDGNLYHREEKQTGNMKATVGYVSMSGEALNVYQGHRLGNACSKIRSQQKQTDFSVAPRH